MWIKGLFVQIHSCNSDNNSNGVRARVYSVQEEMVAMMLGMREGSYEKCFELVNLVMLSVAMFILQDVIIVNPSSMSSIATLRGNL